MALAPGKRRQSRKSAEAVVATPSAVINGVAEVANHGMRGSPAISP